MPVIVHDIAASDLTDAEIDAWRDVPAAIVADLKLGADAALLVGLRPIAAAGAQPRLFGRAVTALCEPPDFGAVLYAVDRIRPGDVLVIAAGGDADTAMIGDIVSGHLRRLGAAGVICDGAVRDVGTLAGWSDFSAFSRSVNPRGPTSADKGAVNAPVTIGGVMVSPGDLLIGDDDGVVVLTPAGVRAGIAPARAKLALEDKWVESLSANGTMRETFGLR